MNRIKLIKTKLFSFVLLSLFFSLLSIVSATGDMVRKEIPVPQNPVPVGVDGKYGVFFCNDKEVPSNKLSLMTIPGQKTEICLFFVNDSDLPIKLHAGIVDGVENESVPTLRDIDCNLEEENNQITNFITSEWGSTSGGMIVDLPAKTRVMRQFSLTYPAGIEGQKVACLVYGLVDASKQAGNMFKFNFRTASYIDIFISSKDFNLGNQLSIKDLSLSVTPENKLLVNGFLVNDGALNEVVSLTGTITNYFGFNRTFVLSGLQVKVGSSTKFSTEALIMDTYVPTFKGLFVASIDAQYKPYFDFDISNMKIDQKVLDGGLLHVSDSLFLMPWEVFGGLLVFIFLIYMAFFRKRRLD